MLDKETMRSTILAETDPLGTKQRFGLFSYPISTAVGDDGPYKTTLHPRADEGKGKPVTQPRNFYAGPCRSGQLKRSFFGDLNSLATSGIKDEYLDPARRILKQENERFYSSCKNENKYKPGGHSETLWKAAFPYIEENPQPVDPKRHREYDGRVKSQPRNICANPSSKIIDTYFKPHQHMEDPYTRAHDLYQYKKQKDSKLYAESKFKPNSFHLSTFAKDKDTYGDSLSYYKYKTPKKYTKFNIYKHYSTWRGGSPGKSGIYGTFSPYLEYISDPESKVARKKSEEKKEVFKNVSCSFTTPSPSITVHMSNIRKYIK